jgi:DNA-binding protein YbaB
MLQDLVTAAVNDGMNKVKQLSEQRMGAVTGGLNIPGLL